MAQKKRSGKRPSTKPTAEVIDLAKALDALPAPARAILSQHVDGLDKFRRQYPALYDVMFKDVNTERYREFEQHLERVQERSRSA